MTPRPSNVDTVPTPPRGFPTGLRGPVNHLSARWAATVPEGKDTVFSAAGAWPLLALLAAGAAPRGPVRPPLEDALGAPAEEALVMAAKLMRWLTPAAEGGEPARSSQGVVAALGLWITDDIRIKDAFAAALPGGIERLTGSESDTERLNAWCDTRTNGIIPSFPMEIPPLMQQMAMFTSAIALQTRWKDTFWEYNRMLSRTTEGAGIIRAAPNVTLVCVEGHYDVDVHLVLGQEGALAAEVLPLAMNVLSRRPLENDKHDPKGLDEAPGLRTEMRTEKRKGIVKPRVHLRLPKFAVEGRHDLTECDLGITALGLENNFPNITDVPMGIASAAQVAKAEFNCDGFSAAAITTEMAVGAAPPPREPPPEQQVLHISVQFDRPFGFLATQSVTKTVLFAGWIAEGFDGLEW